MNQFAIPRRSFLGGAMSLPAIGGAARAQEWPSRAITILVGFGAGGITDVATRLLAEQLRLNHQHQFCDTCTCMN